MNGTTIGTVTDFNGEYILKVPENAQLVVSYIGYITQYRKTGSQNTINFTLKEDSKVLSEVVVVGYGSQKRKEITGSVASMKMAELPSTGAASVSQLLSGRATGLNTNLASAQPGGKVDLRIRGKATGREPLIVIDGFPVSNFNNASAGQFGAGNTDAILASVNPNDIASIDILKDASATSCLLYTSDAADE